MTEGQPISLKPTPRNFTMTWGTGSKSLVLLESCPIRPNGWANGNGLHQEDWHEAPRGEQISEEVCKLLFHKALELAKKNKGRAYHYIRMDAQNASETENNRPFRVDEGRHKDIIYEGCIYRSDEYETGWYGKGEPPEIIIKSSDPTITDKENFQESSHTPVRYTKAELKRHKKEMKKIKRTGRREHVHLHPQETEKGIFEMPIYAWRPPDEPPISSESISVNIPLDTPMRC